MPDIIGCIPAHAPPSITESPAWPEPTRILILSDAHGRRHGRVEWLEGEVDELFLKELAGLCAVAMRNRSTRSSAASL